MSHVGRGQAVRGDKWVGLGQTEQEESIWSFSPQGQPLRMLDADPRSSKCLPSAKHALLDPSLNGYAPLIGPRQPSLPLFSQLRFPGDFLAPISELSEYLHLIHVLFLVFLEQSPSRPTYPPKSRMQQYNNRHL